MACCIKGCNSRGGKKGLEKKSLFTSRTVSIYVGYIKKLYWNYIKDEQCCIYVKEEYFCLFCRKLSRVYIYIYNIYVHFI